MFVTEFMLSSCGWPFAEDLLDLDLTYISKARHMCPLLNSAVAFGLQATARWYTLSLIHACVQEETCMSYAHSTNRLD